MEILGIATVLLLLCTLLPVSHHPHWLIRGFDFPRLQLAVLALVLLFTEFWVLHFNSLANWALLSVTAGCFAWQSWWIAPYTPFWRKEVLTAQAVEKDRQLSVMTANVLTPNREVHKLVELVYEHQPDVLVTLESDQWWEDQLQVLEQDMPHVIKCPLDNLYGMHVYSRLPLKDPTIEYLVEDDIPSIHALLILRSNEAVRMHFLHPAPPSPTENPESAERDAEVILVGRSVAQDDNPVVVTGDLNDVAWSRTTRLFRKLSGLLDPRIGRGMFNTFHADYFFLRWPLDHLFHSDHFTLISILRLPHIGSDHFALLTRLALSSKHGAEQNGLEADASDHALGDEILDAQNAEKSAVPKPARYGASQKPTRRT